ncbi:MAG: mechanosensitive ion channel domain-containing protein [Chitinophagales bacterium]
MEEANVEELTQQGIDYLFEVGPSILLAIITLFVGLKVINLLVKFLRKTLEKSSAEESLNSFLTKLVSVLLKVMLVISVVSMLGVDTTSFIAVLGAAGLAVGLALQGSLANFAGGVLILLFKPFKLGEFIEGQGNMGTVERIDILHTVLNTPDNKVVVIPNGQLANSPVTNYSRKETRRVDFPVGISYGSDIKKAREVILRVISADERVLQDPAPMVVLTELADSSLNLSARAWTKVADYWGVFWDNLEKIKEELDKEGIEIPFPQRDVHMFNEK